MKSKNNSIVKFKQMKYYVLNQAHPINSYFITQDSSFDPNTEFGGTWTKLPNGSVIMASESDNSSNTNIILPSNLPRHTHNISDDGEGTFGYTTLWRDVGQGTPFHTGYFNYEDVNDVTIGYGATGMDMMKIKLSNHKHGGKTGENTTNDSLDLTTILKHPICYIWLRTN